MLNFLKLENKIKSKISDKRFRHTLGVVEKSLELAKKYNINIEKVEIAAMLHDVCKEESLDNLIILSKKYFEKEITKEILENPELLHGFAGGTVAIDEFLIKDREIIDAIKYHTVGKKNFGMVGLIVYIADIIEKNRNFPGVEKIREKVDEDLFRGAIFAIDELNDYLQKDQKYIHPNIYEMRMWLTSLIKNKI